jgi:hypothetical protein
MAATVLRRVGRVALSAVGRPTHYQGEAVALGIGGEVSWMREITLEDYKRAERQLELKEARRAAITDRQARVQQRAATIRRAA